MYTILRFTGTIWQFREYIEDRLALHRKDDESFKSFREVRLDGETIGGNTNHFFMQVSTVSLFHFMGTGHIVPCGIFKRQSNNL